VLQSCDDRRTIHHFRARFADGSSMLVDRALDRAVRPIGAVARAAVRPETYPGHAREAVSIVLTAAVWPFGLADRGLAELRRLVRGDDTGGRPPALLVHGFGANKSNWLFLQRDLRAAGFGRVDALNYNPLLADVPALAEACARRARRLAEATGSDRVHLVGHSLGGIVVRYAVQLCGLDDIAATCITVASPHQGIGNLGCRVVPSRTIRQLAEGSAVLRRLSASSRPLPTRFVAYYSNLDLLVPGHRARIVEPALRATNVLIKDEGHLSILLSRRLSASLLHELGAANGEPGHGSPLAGLPPAA
jgi:triacylglycerol lipase